MDPMTRVVNALHDTGIAVGAALSRLHPEATELAEVIGHTLRGGKLTRPRLILAVLEGYDCGVSEDAIHTCVSVELLHTALLIHDDVIDRDLVRRNRPNPIGVFSSRLARRAESARPGLTSQSALPDRVLHDANSIAVIIGDLLLARAFAQLSQCSERHRAHLQELFDQAVLASVLGEYLDVMSAWQGDEITADSIADLKTGCYSFALPLLAGAELAGASQPDREALREIAATLGTAYQMADDLRGTFGDESDSGRPGSSDLSMGRETAVTAAARALGHGPDLDRLRTHPELDLAYLRLFLRQCGAQERTQSVLAQHTAAARERLQSSQLPVRTQQSLAGFVDLVQQRACA